MTVEAVVADHYSSGTLLSRITDALGKIGKDLSSVTASDLKPVDEFHIGGLAATQELMDQVPLPKESRVLDIGSGIGGTARFLTSQYGCTVHGIDLTPEFVETAQALCAAVGVAPRGLVVAGVVQERVEAELSAHASPLSGRSLSRVEHSTFGRVPP